MFESGGFWTSIFCEAFIGCSDGAGVEFLGFDSGVMGWLS